MRLKRETYLKQICPYDDSNVTKVITGGDGPRRYFLQNDCNLRMSLLR